MARPDKNAPEFKPYALPEFRLPFTAGNGRTGEVSSESLKGQWVVLFAYPKDDTPTCLNENIAFGEAIGEFERRGVALYGLSPDSISSHEKFMARRSLSAPLISDTDRVLIEALGAWVEKSMYGRTYMGVDRSTYIISPQGLVVREWRKVKIKSHTDEVLKSLDEVMRA